MRWVAKYQYLIELLNIFQFHHEQLTLASVFTRHWIIIMIIEINATGWIVVRLYVRVVPLQAIIHNTYSHVASCNTSSPDTSDIEVDMWTEGFPISVAGGISMLK